MLKEDKIASREDIKILKDAIETAHNQKTFVRGWFSKNLDELIRTNNIYRFYRIQDEGFATAIGYAITKDCGILLLEHDINNVNTAMCISHYYAKYEVIRNNFFDLYRKDMYSDEEYGLMISFRQDLREEGIDPWFIELRNQNRTDDEKEKIIKWTNTKEESIEFAEEYIKNHPDITGYYIGEDEEIASKGVDIMENKSLDFGIEIVNMLREKGINVDGGLSNNIILKVSEAYETGKEHGIKEGIESVCKDIEVKLSVIRSKNN